MLRTMLAKVVRPAVTLAALTLPVAVAGALDLLPSASVDAAFGASGGHYLDAGGDELFADVLLQPDGSLVAVGSAGGRTAFLTVRFTDEGAYDAGFGSGGVVVTPLPGDEVGAAAAALQPDGRIVVAGTSGDYGATSITIVRYLADGSLDPGFGSGGVVATEVVPGSHNWADAVVVQPDGRIVVAGTVWSATYDVVAVRYLTDGTLDATFGDAGVATLDVGGDWDFGYGLALQPDGALVVVGRTRVAGDYEGLVARILPDGTPDGAFGGGGTVVMADRGLYVLGGVRVLPGGAILAVGTGSNSYGDQIVLAKLLPSGGPDPAFGADGVATSGSISAKLSASALEVLVDGRVITVGREYEPAYGTDLVVACFLPDGTLDTGFDGGVQVLDPGGTYDRLGAVVAQRGGRIVAVGQADHAGSMDALVVGLEGQQGALVFWDGFDEHGADIWSAAVP